MKVLMCHNYYQRAGGESEVFENEIRGLKMMGHQVIVYSRDNTDLLRLSFASRLKMLLSSFWSLGTYTELKEIIRRESIDLAIVQNVFPLISPSIYYALSEMGIPIIQAVYNYRFVCPSGELYTEGQICERCVPGNTLHAAIHRCYRSSYLQSAWYASIIGVHRLLRTFSNRVSSFMVPDAFLGRKLAQGGIPATKIWSNPNPFYISDSLPPIHHEGYLLFVGRLVRQKGVITAIDAMEHVKRASKLTIVGQGELESEIRMRVGKPSNSSRIIFMGARWGEELDMLIRNCTAVLIPSEWYDNLPVMICRANALGKPVIASNIDGIPEYVQYNVNGFLFEPGDPLDLAAKIDTIFSLSQEEYAALAGRARAYAESIFNYPHHYRRLMQNAQHLVKTEEYVTSRQRKI